MTITFRSFFAALALASLTVTPAASASGCPAGAWEIYHDAIGVNAWTGGAFCGQAATGKIGGKVALEDGQVPELLFLSDVLAWRKVIGGWKWLTPKQRNALFKGVVAFYGSLGTQVDEFVAQFPDYIEVTPKSGVNWFGFQKIGVYVVDDYSGHAKGFTTWTHKSKCDVFLANVWASDGGAGGGFAGGGLGTAWVVAFLKSLSGKWSVNATLVGLADAPGLSCGLAVAANLSLTGSFTLVPVDEP